MVWRSMAALQVGNLVFIESTMEKEDYLDILKQNVSPTCIIGHYNPSVRIIDLVSHTTYVVCVNFKHKSRDLQYKVDSERQIF